MSQNKRRKIELTIWISALILAALLLIGASVAKGSGQAEQSYTIREVCVKPGNGFWDIYAEYGYGRWDKWLGEMKELNGMEQSGLQEGQVVKILEVVDND